MFWSKIWLFIAAALAAVSLTVALAIPKPAARDRKSSQELRLRRACLMSNILMKDNARSRIQLAQEFSTALRDKSVASLLVKSAKNTKVSADTNAAGRKALNTLLDDLQGTRPSFVMLLDPEGRVAAQAGDASEKQFGESLAGYYLVDDAIAGYVLDDLWIRSDSLYRVAAAPLFNSSLDFAGAVVLGHVVDADFASSMKDNLKTSISFYHAGESGASSDAVPIHAEIATHSETLRSLEEGNDCLDSEILHSSRGEKNYQVAVSRLPGEAGQLGAYYAVYFEDAQDKGFMATISKITQSDLALKSFPWIAIGGVFLGLVLIGLLLMSIESDRPLKKLNADALELAKGDNARMNEFHKGKYGSVARSVNIALDKGERATAEARKNMDDLLGPAPETSPSHASPSSMGAAVASPPPSEFKFSAPGLGIEAPPPGIPASSGLGLGLDSAEDDSATNQHVRPASVGIPDGSGTAGPTLDDDILGNETLDPPTEVMARPPLPNKKGSMDQDYRELYKEFVALKKECGESVSSLSYERFESKLLRNRQALMDKHKCKTVRFQVYQKDGKAALKASPIRA